MQFVFNHQTFDPDDELGQKLLAVYAPLGVAPGRSFDLRAVADIDGALFREVAESVAAGGFSRMSKMAPEDELVLFSLFLPKGEMDLDLLVLQSVVGPIGQPAAEAVYPPRLRRPMDSQ